MTLATLRNVHFTHAYADRAALTDVDLVLRPGVLYGLVGPNGSGKSTLCSLLRGMIPHFQPGELSGEVTVHGTDVRDWDPVDLSNQIGYVFQNPFSQISGIKDTVFEEVAFGLENLGRGRDTIIERTVEVIHQTGIERLARKNPNELSGGQRQMVAFASIIAMDADVILIDEPTSQLDPESSEAVFGIIRGLKERGKSVLLVEHKVDLLAEYTDRLIVMKRGEVMAEGDTRTVLESEVLDQAEIVRPEMSRLAIELERIGHALPSTPITRAEAHALITGHAKESDHAP